MKLMQIGEIAKLSGVGIETIRFYEREGLLPEPERRPSGYRVYDGSCIERLEYIRRAKELGFALGEIRDLLELSYVAGSNCGHIRQRAEAKIADIESRVRSLKRMKSGLLKIVQRCRTKHGGDDCPLVLKSARGTKPQRSRTRG